MYGTPGFDVGVFSAFLTATIGSILDSIADYYAVARVVRVPSPPVHAMNRGILVEGFMSMMAGFWGAAHGTTTYAGNIGVIGLTKVRLFIANNIYMKYQGYCEIIIVCGVPMYVAFAG